MSNDDCARLYERIIDDVIQESRQDFEDSGIDEQTLLDLRRIWREKLSKTGVAHFSWDKQREEQEAKEKQLEAHEQAMEAAGSAIPYGLKPDDAKLPTSDKPSEESSQGIVLPGGQTDGAGPEVEITVDSTQIPRELRLEMAKRLRMKKKKQHHHNIPQADGANDSSSDSGSDLGSDLGIGSDEINSDLDDPDEDDLSSDEDNDNGNIMLCLYDRVQRVRNRWKCSLKDGIANIDGKDYAFQKATGDSEW